MEKIKIYICGREYNLLSDDSPNRIINIAKLLEKQIKETSQNMKNRTEQEILTIIALNILDDTEKQLMHKEKELTELRNLCFEKEEQIETEKQKNDHTLNENIKSAKSELEQIAAVKEEENESLRHKLLEYEKSFEFFSKEREDEINKLNESYKSAISEMEHIAVIKEAENEKLRNALSSYESSFDLYAKLKEDEIINLRSELDNARAETDGLRQRLAAVSDDGQLTIC